MPASNDQEIQTLRIRVRALEAQIRSLGHEPHPTKEETNDTREDSNTPQMTQSRPIELEEYIRYGRQMILPGFGLPCELNYNSLVLSERSPS